MSLGELEGSARLEEALYRIAETASLAMDMGAFYAALHRIVGSLMYAENFFIALHDPARDVLTFPYFRDVADPGPPPEVPAAGTLTGYVVQSGRALRASDEELHRLMEEGLFLLRGAHAIDWLGVPLQTASRTWGALVVQSYTLEHAFSRRDEEILTFVSRHIALALERRSADDARNALAAQYRLLFDANPQPMWVYDLETLRFLDVNEAAVAHYGWSREELLKMTIEEIRPAEDVADLRRAVAAGTDGFDAAGIWRHKTKTGRELDVEITSHRIQFDGRRAEFVMAIDVTERRSLEDQLRQSQKMDAVGKLAGGIAHDFNNLLTTILGYGDLLLARTPPNDPTHEPLAEIRSAAERAAALTRRLLAFSRKQVIEPRILDLNSVVVDARSMLRPLIGEDYELAFEPGEELWRVRADPGQVEQILLNLVLNARDAMPGGGRIAVATKNVELTEEDSRERFYLLPGSYVKLSVTDTGVGMDEATQRRIFEPFFTTKPKGKGTGLGLAVVYGIVKQSGGYVWVSSAAGRGSAFHVFLPRASSGEVPAPRRSPAPVAASGGRETILLVEDEERIRTLMNDVLTAAGYRVIDAVDGVAALAAAADHPSRIHMVLTDVVMPRMNGKELVGKLVVTRPGIKVLYTSGYTDDALSAHDILDAGADLLKKPFTPRDLLARVRKVLRTRSSS